MDLGQAEVRCHFDRIREKMKLKRIDRGAFSGSSFATTTFHQPNRYKETTSPFPSPNPPPPRLRSLRLHQPRPTDPILSQTFYPHSSSQGKPPSPSIERIERLLGVPESYSVHAMPLKKGKAEEESADKQLKNKSKNDDCSGTEGQLASSVGVL
jgi:hypothetical protein